MEVAGSMASKRFTPSSCDGLTVIELLVGMAITLGVMAAGLTLALAGLSLYEADHARTRLNQNLRATQDFLARDIRQAGERLGDDFPAIEILDGTAGAPDELILRRNLLGTVLRSCQLVEDTVTRVYLVDPLNPVNGCQPVPDSDGDTWADNHGAWNAYRLANGVDVDGDLVVPGYIFNPVTGDGEFFGYVDDDQVGGYLEVPSGHVWQDSYPIDDQCRVYLLEERRYRVEGQVLQLIVNGEDPNPLNLVERIEDLQLLAAMQDGTSQASLTFADVWADLRAIDVTIHGRVPYDDGELESTWSSELMPRNVLSH